MAAAISRDLQETRFIPYHPPATRTVGFLLRSLPPAVWALLYVLFSAPLLWDNWQKLAEGPVPVWRWIGSLLFPFMLFGLISILQKAGGRRDPAILRPDGLYLGRRGALKSFWTPTSCTVETVSGVEGVYRLVIRATTPISRLTGSTVTVFSGLTDDPEHAREFAVAFKRRYGAS